MCSTGLSNHNNPQSTGREPVWGLCQLLSMSVPIMDSGTGEKTIGYFWEHTGPTVN